MSIDRWSDKEKKIARRAMPYVGEDGDFDPRANGYAKP